MLLLETTSSDSHDDQTNGEACDGATGTRNNTRNRRDDQNGMSDQGHCDGCKNGAESTPILIGHIGAGQWHDIGPELVD